MWNWRENLERELRQWEGAQRRKAGRPEKESHRYLANALLRIWQEATGDDRRGLYADAEGKALSYFGEFIRATAERLLKPEKASSMSLKRYLGKPLDDTEIIFNDPWAERWEEIETWSRKWQSKELEH